MKPSKACFGAFLTIVPLLFCTCRKPEFTEPVPLAPTAAEVQTAVERTELSADDAAKVAIRYCNADAATRTDAAPAVRNVLTIRDAAGRPALYAVNMQEGYLLVSATKCCYPVLAQIDRGTFALDREPSGLDVILQELIETVEAARDSLVVFDCRPAWRPYEERIGPERIRTRMNDDELYDIQNEWYQKWYDEGADVHRLTPKPDDMPEDLYRRFCETAEGDDAWVDTEYNYLNTAVITTKYYDNVNKTGPLLSTRWNQTAPYNSQVSGGKVLGCVTIAVGQLMRYYRHPASFDWSNHARCDEQYDLVDVSGAVEKRVARNRQRFKYDRQCATRVAKLRVQLFDTQSQRNEPFLEFSKEQACLHERDRQNRYRACLGCRWQQKRPSVYRIQTLHAEQRTAETMVCRTRFRKSLSPTHVLPTYELGLGRQTRRVVHGFTNRAPCGNRLYNQSQRPDNKRILIMKKLSTILIALAALLNTACKDDADSEGGYLAHDVYMLDGRGLIPLHNHTVDIDSNRHDVDIRVVSEGVTKIEKLDETTGISLTIQTGFTEEEAVIYDYIPVGYDGETRNIPRYEQTLRIAAAANAQKQARASRFRIITQNPMLECADITIRQAGK